MTDHKVGSHKPCYYCAWPTHTVCTPCGYTVCLGCVQSGEHEDDCLKEKRPEFTCEEDKTVGFDGEPNEHQWPCLGCQRMTTEICAYCEGVLCVDCRPNPKIDRCIQCIEYNNNSSVNHPSHYNMGTIEVIAVIEDWKLTYNAGTALKYIGRHSHKGKPVEDLEKAVWCLQREIERLKGKNSE